jgi:hypothetical protein
MGPYQQNISHYGPVEIEEDLTKKHERVTRTVVHGRREGRGEHERHAD